MLASADTSGVILVWDVSRGDVLATLQDGTKGVLGKGWDMRRDVVIFFEISVGGFATDVRTFVCLTASPAPPEMEWLGGCDGSEHLLAALHPPYSLVLWDTRHSTKVWKKSYTENLTSFHFDPFHSTKMACKSHLSPLPPYNSSYNSPYHPFTLY